MWLACSSIGREGGSPQDAADPSPPFDTANADATAALGRDAATLPTTCPASAAGDLPLGSETPPASAHWKVTDAESGNISLRRLDAGVFDFGPTLDATRVAAWQAMLGVSSPM